METTLANEVLRLLASSPWFDVKRSADYLGVSQRQIRRLISDGRLPSQNRPGIGIRISRKDLDSYLLFEKPWRKLTRPQKAEIKEGLL